MGHTQKTILIGAHVSIADGFEQAIKQAESIDATAAQLFLKSSRSWFAKPISDEEAKAFKQTWEQSTIEMVVAHSAYLINIGSPNKKSESLSCRSLLSELHRCEKLGISQLIIHPGSHLGTGVDSCIKRIAQNLDATLDQSEGTTKILLESMAGQGTNIGSTFEQLEQIRQLMHNKRQVGFCLDTCHLFVAGYDLRSEQGYLDTMKQFDRIVGIEHIKVLHINDSKEPFDSHKDRHEEIGKGQIPLTVFKEVMNDTRLQKIPKILETPAPKGIVSYRDEIRLLKKLVD